MWWYRNQPQGDGYLAMDHALLAIRDPPPIHHEACRAWRKYYMFEKDEAHAADHLPPHARTVTGPPSPQRDEMIRHPSWAS